MESKTIPQIVTQSLVETPSSINHTSSLGQTTPSWFPRNSNDTSTNTSDELLTDGGLQTTETPTTESGHVVDSLEHRISEGIYLYGMGVTFTVGIPSNILVFLVFRSPFMKKTSASVYLSILAITDSVVLLTAPFFRHIIGGVVGYDVPSSSRWVCWPYYLILYVSVFYSSNLLAMVTLDRCVAVALPLRGKAFCSRRVAKWLCFVVFLIELGWNCNLLWSQGPIYKTEGNVTTVVAECVPIMDSEREVFNRYIRPQVGNVLYSIIPFSCIIICNIIIVTVLVRASAGRKRMVQAGSGGQDSNDTTMRNISVMVIVVSVTFLLTAAPVSIFVAIIPVNSLDYKDASYNPPLGLAWAIILWIQYVNNAINFYLYCMCGKQFRRGLLDLCCTSNQQPEVSSNAISLSTHL